MRDLGHQGTESLDKGSIDVIGDKHQVGIVFFDDVDDLFPFAGT